MRRLTRLEAMAFANQFVHVTPGFDPTEENIKSYLGSSLANNLHRDDLDAIREAVRFIHAVFA